MTITTRNTLKFAASALALSIAAPAIAGDIDGKVTDASETIALRSAEVTIVELDRSTATARDGSFRFNDVPAGTYTLEVRYVGADPFTQTIEVPATGTVSAELRLTGRGSNDEILVIGQAANLSSALSRKRENVVVSDVLSRDAIGQFPDQNVAESLRRLPGVNVLNDQGEGRFVSIRGLSPSLSRIPACDFVFGRVEHLERASAPQNRIDRCRSITRLCRQACTQLFGGRAFRACQALHMDIRLRDIRAEVLGQVQGRDVAYPR